MSFYSIAHFIKEFYPEYYSIESYPVNDCVRIHKVAEEWGIFSNFAKTPLVVNGIIFDSAEELFQMMKFKDKIVLLNIKSYEKDFRREDWGKMIVDAIKFCLQTKYDQSKEFRDALEKSKGKFIVEDQTSFPKKTPDTWGVKLQGDCYVGPSLLGRLLMELRDNGKLEYKLPEDALDFVEHLR